MPEPFILSFPFVVRREKEMAEKRFFYAIMVFVFRCWIFHRRVPKYNVDVFINAVVTDGTDLSTGFSVFFVYPEKI